uniref:(northern house mosquito) hypothetical protein n=1 Tax=Culex pipiens TaxID=7175 RepID=A0A8D8IVW4_CULPI
MYFRVVLNNAFRTFPDPIPVKYLHFESLDAKDSTDSTVASLTTATCACSRPISLCRASTSFCFDLSAFLMSSISFRSVESVWVHTSDTKTRRVGDISLPQVQKEASAICESFSEACSGRVTVDDRSFMLKSDALVAQQS